MLPKLKKTTSKHKKKTHNRGQTQHGNCYCGIRFLRLFYVKQSSVACIFYILRPSSWYSTLRIKKTSKSSLKLEWTATTDFFSFKSKLQDQHISKHAKWFICLRFNRPILIICLIIFIVWKAECERFNVVTPARFTNFIEHLQFILAVRLTKCYHLIYLSYIPSK